MTAKEKAAEAFALAIDCVAKMGECHIIWSPLNPKPTGQMGALTLEDMADICCEHNLEIHVRIIPEQPDQKDEE